MSNPQMPGQVVDESFRIISLLGEGGIGEVYLAVQIALERQVAIKFLRTYLTDDLEWQARFKREGHILSTLQNSNIVQCYASGAWQGRIPYLVFEYLEGKSFKEIISRQGRLPWRYVLKVAREVCYALQYAHASSVIHRDLKPENIMVLEEEPEPRIKVVDFGLSCCSDRDTPGTDALTRTGELIGTVSYMSPEQCLGQKADQRADFYALGCIMFQAVTGVLPFDGDSPVNIIYKHTSEAAPLPSSIVSEIPQTIDYVIMKSLAKNRDDRYATASEMLADIQRILQSETNLQLSEIAQGMSHNLQEQLSRRNSKSSRRNIVVIVCGLLLLCGLLLFAFTDPGPAILLSNYADLLPPERRLSFLEQQGDYCIADHRPAAAELLYSKASSLVQKNDLDTEISIYSKLAQVALLRIEKAKALRDASYCLHLADINETQLNERNSKTILRACKVIEELAPAGDAELVHSLDWFREEQKPVEIIVNATIAEQGLRCDDRLTVEKRALQLISALLKSEMEGRNDWIIRLVNSSQKRPDRSLYCRHPLNFAVIAIKVEAEKGTLEPHTAWGVSNCINQSILSDRAGSEAERSFLAHLFLTFFCRAGFEWKAGHAEIEHLQLTMENKNTLPILRCEIALLNAAAQSLKNNLSGAVDSSELALGILRSLKIHEKRRGEIFEAIGDIIGTLPDGSPEKDRLLLFFLDEAKVQSVRLNSSQLISLAQSYFDRPGQNSSHRKLLCCLLDTAKANPDYDEVYFGALADCASKAVKSGDKGAQQLLDELLKGEVEHAFKRDLGPYYRYMSEQCSRREPAASKKYEALAIASEHLLQAHRLGKDFLSYPAGSE